MREFTPWEDVLREEMSVALATPLETPAQLGFSLRAMASARVVLASSPALVGALSALEDHIANVSPALRDRLVEAVTRSPALGRMEDALRMEDLDLAQDALLGLEDCLAVLGELRLGAAVSALQHDIILVLRAHPRASDSLRPLAELRETQAPGAAKDLWRALLALGEAPPETPALKAWFERLGALAAEVLAPLVDQVRLAPVVALSQRERPAWDVTCTGPSAEGDHLALYLVTAQAPEGERLYPNSDYHMERDRWVFEGLRLRGETDEALLVVIWSAHPVASELSAALSGLHGPDAKVDFRRISPPTARRP